MCVLGIDPSLNSLGYAYRDTRGVETDRITSDKRRGMVRLNYIENEIANVYAHVEPSLVVYEGYAMGIRGGRVFDLGELGGVLKLYLFRQGCPILLVPPATLKQFSTGKGNADKAEMCRLASKELGRKVGDDEADAYMLLKVGEAYLDARLLPRSRDHYKHTALACCSLVV